MLSANASLVQAIDRRQMDGPDAITASSIRHSSNINGYDSCLTVAVSKRETRSKRGGGEGMGIQSMYCSTPTTHSSPWHCCQISEKIRYFPNRTVILSLRVTHRMSVISDESRPPEASRTAGWSVLVTSSFDKALLPKILFKEEIYFRFSC